MKRRWLPVAVLGVALAGCQVSREADADPVEFTLNQEFPLGGDRKR